MGEPFRVQYVLEDIGRNPEFFPPDFKDFRFISGPIVYEGTVYSANGPKKMKNYVYTLEAIRPGRFVIPGASARVEDHFIESDDALVEVISRAEATRRQPAQEMVNAHYFLQPGENPQEKIRKNLFLKVAVDRNSCYVGEPVTATFKLYSRLVSKSDIIKNPGFYGFTVQDMIGLDDKITAVETIDGKRFDVHTVRKVQLYPLREGLFLIDPMDVQSKVEFSHSRITRKAEQEITEGVYSPDPEERVPGTVTYESSISTKSVSIRVKPLPDKGRPAAFAGATGQFHMSATIEKDKLARNEAGLLVLKISGKGNFTQLPAPVIKWPAGIEGFDPKITDTLDHTHAPLNGTRTFQFSFTSARSGSYVIPAVSFSFFDPDSNRYKTVSTRAIDIRVSNEEKAEASSPTAQPGQNSKSTYNYLLWLASFVFIAALAVIIWNRKRKKTVSKISPIAKQPGIEEILQPAVQAAQGENKLFYATLRYCIWQFFALQFGWSGSQMNLQHLGSALSEKGMDESSRQAILDILQQCDAGMFTDAHIEADKEGLLKRTKEVLMNFKV